MAASETFAGELHDLAARDLLRSRRLVEGMQGPEILLDGGRVICLASNNYLGLAGDPRVVQGAIRALEECGAGASASPLISGHMEGHAALEAEIAAWLGCEAALVFGSGYHANIGLLSTLAGEGDVIFSDELNHASLIDGCRLSRARVCIYRHRDVAHLGALLDSTSARRRLVITDSVFSMDGDRAPLEELVDLAARYDAWTMLDEAHAIGVFGKEGAGAADAAGLGSRITVRMGTLGKALGSYGAFVAGSRTLIDLLVNRARAYVFSTGLPPAVVGAARAALVAAREEGERRARLWRNARRLHEGLHSAGLRTKPLESTIVPLILGEPAAALSVARRTLERGVFSPAIRPPTVPPGTSRMRLTPIATHTDEQIDRSVTALVEAVREIGA
jgi:8-amino-7-oxononanoate synthase